MKKNRLKKLDACVSLGFIVFSGLFAQAQTTYSEIVKKLASDRLGGDKFGYSVAVDGNYAVVGAPYHAHGITGAGSAYIFERDVSGNWNQLQEIMASDRQVDDHFGWSVSISGDDIIVGAPDEDHDANGLNGMASSGSVYFFRKSGATWAQTYKLVASDRETGDQMGWSVDLFLHTAVAGAPNQEDPGGSNEGAIYVMGRSSSTGPWSLTNKAKANDKRNDDHLGYSVSIYNSEIAAGAPDQDYDALGAGTLVTDAGAVYSFMKSSGVWSQTQKMIASDRKAGDKFGFSVSRYNVALVVGAPNQDYTTGTSNLASNAGAAYVFDKSGTWSQTQKIVASDRAAGDNFGWSVARTHMDIVVGAPNDDRLVPSILLDAGSMYVFNAQASASWVETQKLLSSDIAASDNFGYAVSVAGTRIIVGAPGDDHTTPFTQTDAGSAYVMEGCSYPATISPNDVPVAACIGEDLQLDAFLGFGVSVTYQWQIHNGSTYGNVVDGAVYSGSTGPFLNIVDIPHCMDGSRYRCKITAACGAVIYFYFVVNVDAASFNEKDEVFAGVTASGDRFGDDVAISGSYAIVGAPFEDEDAAEGSTLTDAGSAYIYERDGSGNWILVDKIVADNRGAGANFGLAVDIYGDYAVVGAPNEDIAGSNQTGAIYIYQRSAPGVWEFIKKRTAPFLATDDQFGSSVAIDEDLQIIVGARNEDQNSGGTAGTLSNAGAAYVYTIGTNLWDDAPYTIVPTDRAAGDNFGWAVDIDGDFAVISAINDDNNSANPSIPDVGSVYIFERNPGNIWLQVQKFDEEMQPGQQYGCSVSIYDGDVVVGSKYTDVTTAANLEGKVYIYKSLPSWQLYQTLTPPSFVASSNFGQDVSVSGNYLVVGANRVNATAGAVGGVHVYEKCDNLGSPWNLIETITGTLGIGYGKSVDIAGGYFMAGAPVKSLSAGSAYVFESCGAPALKSAGTNSLEIPAEATGISSDDVQPSMNCFPNPATDEINLSIRNIPEGNRSLTIIDVNGRTVTRANITGDNNKIPVERIAPGVYFIKLDYNGGTMIQKFVKQ